ncbi:MAG: hypothetical protein ACFFF4_18685 [Candidatus Thorarchaeota archaeon]
MEVYKMVIFGTSSDLIFDINLIIQLFLLLFLVIGVYIKRVKRVTKNHGYIMALATISNLLMTLLIMAPSLIINWGAIVSNPTNPGVIITLIHVVVGLTAIIGGLLFSIRFLFALRRGKGFSCGKRRSMLVVAGFWTLSIIFGLSFYLYYYL